MMSFWMLVLTAVYFFLPAYAANMAPELVKWIPWKTPIWKKKLGNHKTWKGLIVGTLMGGVVFLLQKWLFQFGIFYKISLIDYADFSIMLGLLLGLGALIGDSIESYYKRKRKIKPGESWMPWDQLDFVIGGVVLGWLVYIPKIEIVLVLLIVSPFLHAGASRVGYWLKIKKTKF